MGVKFTDQFSLLHFSTGIIAYFWKITFVNWFIIHLIYEIFTNTKLGIYFINHYTFWPGGKLDYDTPMNILGDQVWSLLGWLFAYFIVSYFYSSSLRDNYLKKN
jgi:hypothetical protein